MITAASNVQCKRGPKKNDAYPLGEAVAVRGLSAPRPDMDVVLGRLRELRSASVLPLLLAAAVLAAALRGLPLGAILLRAIALLHGFATLRGRVLLQIKHRTVKSFAPVGVHHAATDVAERNSARTAYLGEEILGGGGHGAVLAFPLAAGLPLPRIAVGSALERHLGRRIGHRRLVPGVPELQLLQCADRAVVREAELPRAWATEAGEPGGPLGEAWVGEELVQGAHGHQVLQGRQATAGATTGLRRRVVVVELPHHGEVELGRRRATVVRRDPVESEALGRRRVGRRRGGDHRAERRVEVRPGATMRGRVHGLVPVEVQEARRRRRLRRRQLVRRPAVHPVAGRNRAKICAASPAIAQMNPEHTGEEEPSWR